MSELPLKTNLSDPLNYDLLYSLGDPSVFTDLRGGAQRVKSMFYSYNYEQHNLAGPLLMLGRAIISNPDTMFYDYKSLQYTVVANYENLPMESAAPCAHTTYLTVVAALYSNATLIDPGEPCKPCPPTGGDGGTATGCQPIADLEMQAAPIAALEVDAAPVAALDQDDIPEASLTCKILS
jgi:hypothetical protein